MGYRNRPSYGDEINLVEPGFNSGWSRVQGIWRPTENLTIDNRELNPDNLVDFDGKGKYSPPEFMWKEPACVTAIKFLSSDKYGKEYKDDVFVGTSTGNLYHFDMNNDRTGFILYNNLTDKLVTFYFVPVVHSEVLLKNDGIYLIGETHIPSRSKDLNN